MKETHPRLFWRVDHDTLEAAVAELDRRIPSMSDDEILLRQAIAGDVDAGEAMRTIAGRGGHPVATAAGGFLFACLCGPGEWALVGDHNEWVIHGADPIDRSPKPLNRPPQPGYASRSPHTSHS